jgi:hypothetical protein
MRSLCPLEGQAQKNCSKTFIKVPRAAKGLLQTELTFS